MGWQHMKGKYHKHLRNRATNRIGTITAKTDEEKNLIQKLQNDAINKQMYIKDLIFKILTPNLKYFVST